MRLLANGLKTAAMLMSFAAAGCSISQTGPASSDSLRRITGTALIGTRGATPRDQANINGTVAGLCGAAIYTRSECRRHGELVQ